MPSYYWTDEDSAWSDSAGGPPGKPIRARSRRLRCAWYALRGWTVIQGAVYASGITIANGGKIYSGSMMIRGGGRPPRWWARPRTLRSLNICTLCFGTAALPYGPWWMFLFAVLSIFTAAYQLAGSRT